MSMGKMVFLSLQMTGLDHRGLGIGDLPGRGLFFFLTIFLTHGASPHSQYAPETGRLCPKDRLGHNS